MAMRGGMDLHRTVVGFRNRGHYAIIRFFSSDGCDRWQPWRCVEPSGAPDPHQTNSVAIAIIRAIVFHWTADAPRSPSPRDRAIMAIRSPEAPSDGADKTWKNPRSRSDQAAIEPRSRCDRAAIAVLSLGNRLQSIGRRSMKDQDHDRGPIAGPIVARSWPDRGGNRGYLEAKLKPNSHRFVAEIKPRFMPTESPRRRHQTASTIASIAHVFEPNFLFKKRCSFSLFFNF